jgi:DNA-directed RNA polymerase subunit M/transcription elongation factor TFIIS
MVKITETKEPHAMNVRNQGIMHLAGTRGGRPVCRNDRAHMSTTSDRFANEPLRCKKCEAKWLKWQAKKSSATQA